jgi:hypothetical protein
MAATLVVLLVAGSTATPAAAEASRFDAVTSDPHYEAWIETLRASAAGAGPARIAGTSPQACGATDELQEIALRKHRARMRLLESLRARGVQPGPPDAAAVAWPWGPGAGQRVAPQSDSGNTAVLVDDGYIVYTNFNGALEVDPVLAARAFYELYDDEYDFATLFTNFSSELFGGRFLAYHVIVSNDVEGIGFKHWFGDEEIDNGPVFTLSEGRPTRLRSFIHLNRLSLYPDSPEAMYCPFNRCRGYTYPAFIAHTMGHRWGARILLCPERGPVTALIGNGDVHWSFFFNSDASVLEGNTWDGTEPHFITRASTARFGALDLYLMGLIPLSEVPESDLFYLHEPNNFLPETDLRGQGFHPGSPPQTNVSCNAARIDFTRQCLEDVNGVRRPAYPNTQRDFRAVTILVTLPGRPASAAELQKLDGMRNEVAAWFHGNTRQLGTLDFTLRAVPAEVHFAHRAQGDVEDPTQPIEITSEVSLKQRSLPTSLDDLRFSLHYSLGGADFVEGPMLRTGDGTSEPAVVRGTLPPQPDGTLVRYYIRSSTDLSEHEFTTPANAPENTHAFTVRPDHLPPRITHVPVTSHSRNAEPALLRAVVFDDHGVRDVQVEYRLNGGEVRTLPLSARGASDVYESRFVPPGNVGDTVEYRIVATDVSATPHVAALPGAGWFELDVTLVQFEDAESDDPLWTHRSLKPFGVDEWHRQFIHNVTPGGNYSWKAGPDNLDTNPRVGQTEYEQDAVLEGPAVRLGPGWELRFMHRYYLRTSPPDTDNSGVDGAVLQWQDVENPDDVAADRWWLIDPIDGYPKQLGAYAYFNPLQWWPAWSGQQDAFRPVRVNDSVRWPGGELAGRLIRFRFRLATSIPWPRTTPGAGWYIDDIEIDPGTVVPVTLEALRAQRTEAGVSITWRALESQRGDLFHIERAETKAHEQPNAFERRVTIAATPGIEEYVWVDTDVEERTYVYRLRLMSNGVERLARQVRVEAAAPRFALYANRPNPFNPRTEIAFELSHAQRAHLDVYDVGGRHVRTLVDEVRKPGRHRIVWDGTDQGGRAVASGIYLYRLRGDTRTVTRRMMLLR